MSNFNFEKLDPAMKSINYDKSEITGIRWINPMDSNIYIAGFPWLDEDRIYRRLPTRVKDKIRLPLESLCKCTAGGQLHFKTDSKRLYVAVKLSGKANMYHMPATGQCGFDCYAGDDNVVKYLSTTRYNTDQDNYCVKLFEFAKNKNRTVILNFPLYIGVEELLIGIEKKSTIHRSKYFNTNKKMVFYGTSITQGGCASRPGMAYTNILSRELKSECINLGFSGNGKGDRIIAEVMAEIENVSCYVLDYLPNCSTKMFMDTLPEFINILKQKRPNIPVFVISTMMMSVDNFLDDLASEQIPDRNKQRGKIKQFINDLIRRNNKNGIDNIYFINGDMLPDKEYHECTVDGVHPNDLGFKYMANSLYRILKEYI